MIKNLKAFTLAEVMIVMAIIGVTAMLALPALNNNMEEKKVVSALRKIYPELETAYNSMVRDYGKPVEWNASADASTEDMNNLLKERIVKYLNVASDCGTETGCFKSLDSIDSDEDMIKFLLKDGTSVAFQLDSMEDMRAEMANAYSQESECNGKMGSVAVDVNGSKGENNWNYDIFSFNICYADGIVPLGIKNFGENAVTGWVIKVGNRDYLKCDDLDWDTKRTCN